MNLGKMIARQRKLKGLTQVELATVLEVHPSLVTRWERGLVQPRRKVLEKLASVLELSVEELIVGSPSGLTAKLGALADPELVEMVGQIDKLDVRERDALKVVLGAMLKKSQIAEVLQR